MSVTKPENLAEIPAGVHFMICEMNCSPEAGQRLRELGFGENVIVRTIVNASTQLICEIHNTRIGMQRSLAKNILVSPIR